MKDYMDDKFEFHNGIRFRRKTGLTFGKLFVIEYAYSDNTLSFWKCRCACGREEIVSHNRLTRSILQCCMECVINKHRKYTCVDGESASNTRLYNVWCQMKSQCYNPNNKDFIYYGQKLVALHPDWWDFAKFRKWALETGYEELIKENGFNELTIFREDKDGDYSPENCRWGTMEEQNKAKSGGVFYEIIRRSKTRTQNMWNRN